MPAITAEDALIRAADSLTDAIDRANPKPGMTRDAIGQLISIFKAQTKKEKDAVTAQRVAKERAQAERVCNEEAATPMQTEEVQFEVNRYPEIDVGNMSRIGVISRDKEDVQLTPAANTQQQQKEQTVTQEFAYRMIDLPVAMTKSAFATAPRKFSDRQAAS
jgi:hypothetical protein